MAKVDILLATFQGELYIEAQLLSLLSQSFKDWRLLVHDDGSHDHTIDIIRYWHSVDSRICLLEDGIQCGSAAANFMHLLTFASAEYLMFCDQDDIWFDNKVEVMVEAIEKQNTNLPQVVYSNAYVWKPYSDGIVGLATLTYPQTLQQFLFLNSGMQGCVAIFNNEMLELLKQWKGKCAMHDHLLHLFGLTLGNIVYLPLPLMLYRQHFQNVTGDTAVTKNDLKRILVNSTLPVINKDHYDVINEFYEKYADNITFSNKKLIKDFLSFRLKSKIEILLYVIFDRFQLFNSTLRLILKILVRPYTT